MLNQVVLVGRLTKDPEVNKTDSNKHYSHITLAVPRSFKNMNGEYDTDFIDCELSNTVAINTADYCKKGDIIGVKGRIKIDYYYKDGISVKVTKIIAGKVPFLSSKKESKE